MLQKGKSPEIVIKGWFYEFGKKAPRGSNYKGVIDHNSMFGSTGMLNYTSQEKATAKSMDGSVLNYTKREGAVNKSSLNDNYFTMSSSGRLQEVKDYDKFIKENENVFNEQGDIAWEFVVSPKSFDLLKKYNIEDQMDWSRITSSAMLKIASAINVDIANLTWWQDYHTNTTHPHIHLVFIQKDTERSKAKFSKAELKRIKSILVSEIAANQFDNTKEQFNKVDQSKKEVVDKIGMLKYTTFQDIQNLYLDLSSTGRLQYNSVEMIEFRPRLDKIVDDLLQQDGIKESYQSFLSITSSLEANINDKINSKITNLMESEDKKLRIQIANKVLQEFKSFNSTELQKLREWRNEKAIQTLKEYLTNSNIIYDDLIETAENGDLSSALQQTDKIQNETVKGLLTSYLLLQYDEDLLEKKRAESILIKLSESGNKTANKYFKLKTKQLTKYNTAFKQYKRSKRNERLVKYISDTAIREHQREVEEALWKYLHEDDYNQGYEL